LISTTIYEESAVTINLRALALSTVVGLGSTLVFGMDQATYELAYASPECGSLNHFSPALGQENGLSLVMQFFDFEASTSPSSADVSRRCAIEVFVNVPRGMSFRLSKAVADGEYQYSPEGSITFALSYRYAFNEGIDADDGLGTASQVTHSAAQGSENPGIYAAEASGGPDWQFTSCKDHDQRIAMSGTFELNARRGTFESQQSDLALFNSEAIAGPSRPHQALWKWEWKPCPSVNPWDGTEFRSRYTNSSGRWVFGYTSFVGDHGSYQLDTGEYGFLSNIQYADDYAWAQGIWTYQDGSSGWFKFYLSKDQGFDGEYGYGTNVGQSSAGRWKGFYE
jgi:hypothetical protein